MSKPIDALMMMGYAIIKMDTHLDRANMRAARTAIAELIEAATPFAALNSSEPTITVQTPDVTHLRIALAACKGVQS